MRLEGQGQSIKLLGSLPKLWVVNLKAFAPGTPLPFDSYEILPFQGDSNATARTDPVDNVSLKNVAELEAVIRELL